MKSKLLLIILLITAISYGQNVNIPDANLKNHLLNYYDANHDGEIQVTEATAVTNLLRIDNTGTVDLTGIEAFINAEEVKIENENNIVGGLDLTPFTASKSIIITNTSITSVILGSGVETIRIFDNSNLQTINTNNATNLKRSQVKSANITSFDLTRNPNLILFYCADTPVNSITWGSKPFLETLNLTNTDVSGYLDFSDFASLKVFFLILTNNNVTGINLANNNNTNIILFKIEANTSTACIQVDDVTYSTNNWSLAQAPNASFTLNCPNTSLSVQDVNTISDLKVYPNPVKNILNIKTIEDIKKVEIYNTIGKKVIDTNTTKINMGALSTGLYILKIHTNSGKTGIRRFIKSN